MNHRENTYVSTGGTIAPHVALEPARQGEERDHSRRETRQTLDIYPIRLAWLLAISAGGDQVHGSEVR